MTAVLPIQLDRSSPLPLYHQLAEQLTAAITEGRLRPGDPFENEIGMSDRLSLSRPTVRRAISELVNQGLLVRRRGIGTTVANQMVHRKAELTSLYDDMVRRGQKPVTEVVSFSTDDVNPVAADYTVYVHGFAVNGTTPFKLHSWLLGSTAAGDMAVTAPAAATQGATGTINLTFSGLTAATKYLGSVAYGGSEGLPNPTIVRIDTP